MLVDLLPSRVSAAFSVCSFGGRFAILPVADAAVERQGAAGSPGVTRVLSAAGFPVPGAVAGDSSSQPLHTLQSSAQHGPRSRRGSVVADVECTPCLVELVVKRNVSVDTAHKGQASLLAGRRPNGCLRVRCRDATLRSSALDALLQQLLTPQQLVEAAEATLVPKRDRAGNITWGAKQS